jgi:leader peptidase (prepilin peptidase)/N-methyltransferase
MAFSYWIFLSALMAIAFIDIEHQIIPDVISLPGIGVGLLLAWLTLPLSVLQSLIGALVGGGVIYLVSFISLAVLGKEGMGGGDIKLMAMIGTFLGWKNTLLTIFLGSVTGSIIGVSLILFKKKKRDDYIPFGPFLVLGAIISLFLGNRIINWYFRMEDLTALHQTLAFPKEFLPILRFVFFPQ